MIKVNVFNTLFKQIRKYSMSIPINITKDPSCSNIRRKKTAKKRKNKTTKLAKEVNVSQTDSSDPDIDHLHQDQLHES